MKGCLLCDGEKQALPSPIKPNFCRGCLGDIRRVREKLRRGNAHSQVNSAIAKGILPKLDGSIACVDCGRVAEGYDHRDYNKPLEVDPVCLKCNSRRGPGKPLESYEDPYEYLAEYLKR